MFNSYFHKSFKIIFFLFIIINIIYPQDKKESEYYHETFGIVYDYKTQTSPLKLIKGDFNGDGWDDISVIGNDQLKIFYQNNDSLELNYSIINFSERIIDGAISKLQKDIFPIFVIGTTEPFKIRCYYPLNLNKKKILWKTILNEPLENIVLNDLDGDKKTDILLFGRKQLGITYYRGNGDGTFKKPLRLFNDYSFNNISVARLHDGGMPDFVASSWLTNQILIYANNGNLQFSPPYIIDVAAETDNIIAADIDNDNYIDLLTSSSIENTVYLYRGDFGGGFLPRGTKSIKSFPTKIEIADCNNDGVRDIVVGSSTSKNITVFLCDKRGNFVEEIPIGGGESISDMITFRNTKSSSNNLAILDASNCKLKVFYNVAIQRRYSENINYAVGVKPVYLCVEDIDNDRLLDIIVSNNESKSISLFINSSTKGINGQIAYDMPGHPSALNICRNKDNNVVIVTSDYDEFKILISEINMLSFSSKSSTFITHNKSIILNTFSGTKSEPLRIFCLQEIPKNKSLSFVLYQRLQREMFIEKVMNPVPCEILKDLTFVGRGKNIIYASLVSAKNRIDLYHSRFTTDEEISIGKLFFTIDSVQDCSLKLYSVRLNDDEIDDLVVSLGEPENKLYIFYGTKDKFKDISKNQVDVILNKNESAGIQFYDLDNNGLNDITYLNNKTKAIDVRFAEKDGTFGNPRQIKSVGEISDYKFTDLNNDSLPELLLTDSKNSLLKIIRLKD
ncbi:MAG: VCBS repeat-containing protein [Ignavibacteriales bacterium]|nr:VCBS repeat-containing protein [Ignavibacteriales bacterium]